MAAAVQPASPAPTPAPHPLRDRNFRMLWIGSSISLLGDQFYLVALPWVVLQLTGSAIAMGTIMMAAAIPRAVLMLLGGALTDRSSPRRIMINAAWARTIFVAAIGLLLWFHLLKVWELYLLGFAFGVADAFSVPAALTFLPSLVKPEQLVAANSVFQTTAQLTTIGGPTPAALVDQDPGNGVGLLAGRRQLSVYHRRALAIAGTAKSCRRPPSALALDWRRPGCSAP